MGWADFGQALYLNFSNAAGMLAETKLALRAEEREERQLQLQEEVQKAQLSYNKARLVFDEWLATKEQANHDEQMEYKQELLEWQKGEMGRADEARKADAKQELETYIAKAEEDAKRKEEEQAAAEEQEQAELDESVKRLVNAGVPEEQARAIVDENIPDATRSVIAKDARIRESLRRQYPDKTPAEIDAMWSEIINPGKENRTAVTEYLAEVEEIDASDLPDAEKQQLRDAALQRALQKGVSTTASTQTDRQKKIAEAETRWGAGSPEAQQVINDTYGLGDATGSADNAESLIAQSYPLDSANRRAIDGLSNLIKSGPSREHFEATLAAYFPEGSTGPADVPIEFHDEVADLIDIGIQSNIPGGETISKFADADSYTLAQFPRLWDLIKNIPKDDFGKLDEVMERVARAAGTSSDLQLLEMQTIVTKITSRWLRTETGAAVSPGEREVVLSMFPAIGNTKQVNVQLLRTMLDDLMANSRRNFVRYAGEGWGTTAADIKLAGAASVKEQVDATYPTMAAQLAETVNKRAEKYKK